MKLKYIRPLALALCAVLLCSLFTACSGTSSSSEQPSSAASAASDSASASASTSDSALPDSTTQANTGSLNPGNFDENSAFSITGTTDAFAPCLGWGPGVSGCSLKSVIAAASLLQWAESAHLSSRTPEAIQDAFCDWYDSLSSADQENFAEAWTMIEPDALSLLSDKESMTDLIMDAGLDPDTLPGVLSQLQLFQIGIPAFTGLYFDWFGGCIQAFIFCTLTTIFIKRAAGED